MAGCGDIIRVIGWQFDNVHKNLVLHFGRKSGDHRVRRVDPIAV